uniref:Uncharacterized protein n=1 Tax=Periophthalmus magnuspinnatus TaxID=409849 RepID=A0A3B4BF49_9GOBI
LVMPFRLNNPPAVYQALVNDVLQDNALRRQGLKSCSARRACLKFAIDHLDDSEEDWDNVIWLDETKIELFGKNSTCHIWRRKNAKHGGRNIMLWGSRALKMEYGVPQLEVPVALLKKHLLPLGLGSKETSG